MTDITNPPFVIYHNYYDGSGNTKIVYIGNDKAQAFDALWEFLRSDPSQGTSGLSKEIAPTDYMMAVRT